MIDISRTVIWVILLGAGGFVVGCDHSPLVPSSPEWDEIRYHEFTADHSSDLLLTRIGQLSFSEDGPLESVDRDGVLSGGTAVELDEAVRGMERASVGSREPCEQGLSFFVSVTKGESVFSFSGSSCAGLPPGQAALVEALQRFVVETREERLAPVAYRSAGSGRADLEVGPHVVSSNDELTRLLQQISGGQPVLWPPVDFGREMLVGYVGSDDLLSVEITGIATTEGGQIRLQVRALRGFGECSPLDGRPYEFIKVNRVEGDFVIEHQVIEVSCELML